MGVSAVCSWSGISSETASDPLIFGHNLYFGITSQLQQMGNSLVHRPLFGFITMQKPGSPVLLTAKFNLSIQPDPCSISI